MLLYDNQPLKYANYNINAVVNIIDKAIKNKLFEENIIQNLPFLTWNKLIKKIVLHIHPHLMKKKLH